MFSFALRRIRSVGIAGWLIWAALPLIVAAMFALGGDRSYIYRSGLHNYNTAKTLAIAENLSLSHRLRLIHRVKLHADGDFAYTLYARFPVTAYALVKAAILPFGDDLAAKILAGRALMQAMFAASGLLAYFAFVRISGSRLVALAVVPLVYSSYHMVYYSDAVVNEGTMDLFGVMLTFHGMVVFVREGRFGQLAAKTCAALLFGWHVYALLLPFIAFGLGGEIVALIRRRLAERRASRESPRSALAEFAPLVRSRYLALAAVAAIFGSALLGFNAFNEYDTLKDSRDSPLDMSLFHAMSRRIFGQDETFNEKYAYALAWDNFAGRQLMRVGGMSLPYAAARSTGGFDFPETREVPVGGVAIGALVTVGALGGIALVRRRRIPLSPVHLHALPLASIALMGFCWALVARFNTADETHNFESVFYAGAPLTLFTLALCGARAALGKRIGDGLAFAVFCAAAVAFAVSVFQVGKLERDPVRTEFRKNLVAEMSEIRKTTRGKTVLLSADIAKYLDFPRYFEMFYYLAGSYIRYQGDVPPPKPFADHDFVISRYRADSLGPLTPDSRALVLYGAIDRQDLYRAEMRRLAETEPAARGAFDVYLEGKTLNYVKDPCGQADAERLFFLHAYPADGRALSGRQERRSGFYGVNFYLADKGDSFDGVCFTVEDLPGYPVASFRTGQYISGEGEIWSEDVKPPPDADTLAFYESAYRAAAAAEPAARGAFDVYADGKTLAYLKEPCAEEDTRGRFLLSVYPKNPRDIPEERRELGHESLNFDFERWGITLGGGRCIILRTLPDYDVAKVETGQWIPGGERLWTAEFAVDD